MIKKTTATVNSLRAHIYTPFTLRLLSVSAFRSKKPICPLLDGFVGQTLMGTSETLEKINTAMRWKKRGEEEGDSEVAPAGGPSLTVLFEARRLAPSR